MAKQKKIPLVFENIKAGFPSPADDLVEATLDLNDLLIKNPAATFFIRVSGDSMIEDGIFDNDILLVDRSIPAKHNKIVLALVDGEFTVKKLYLKNKKTILIPGNKKYKPIEITNDKSFEVWGTVLAVIRKL
jgi:DNA polymerase V